MRAQRASIKHAIELIALNDEPTELEVDVVQGLASVLIIAALFGLTQLEVAERVVRYRMKEDGTE
jgi:hypothetical protein